VTALHQVIPVLDPADAVSGHTLQVQSLLHGLGVESAIFAERTHPSLEGKTRPYSDLRTGAILYQFAIGNHLADLLAAAALPLAIDYHNLTPPELFEQWDISLMHGTQWGRAQLARLADRCSLGLADSAFNERDLIDLGYRHTGVAPIIVDLSNFDNDIDEATQARLLARKARGGADWLFVGRLVPSKAQHDLVKAFAVYRRHCDPEARLWLVGGAASRRYEKAVHGLATDLGLDQAVAFTGSVSPGALAAHYASADVFVTMSRHEGFCVPVLEAFRHDLPVIAVRSGALPETIGDAGLLLADRAPDTVALTVDRLMRDTGLRTALTAAGRRRLESFSVERTRAVMAGYLTTWLGEVGS
jgi:glycosyltransferase involved in cell wall biosynthesis